jgi:hypothetical protein
VDLAQPAENEVKMKSFKCKSKLFVSIVSSLVFAGLVIANAIMFWTDVIGGSFAMVDGFVNTTITIPTLYLVLSSVFVAVTVALLVLGKLFDSKVLTGISACYGILLVMALVLLIFFATGMLTNPTLYDIIMWAIVVIISPVFGFVWIAGLWSLLVFLPTVIAAWIIFAKQIKRSRIKK